MKHIPILFSTAMVQAILDGRKTQTRRVIKDEQIVTCLNAGLGKSAWTLCPYGEPGDILWVRESFVRSEFWSQDHGCTISLYAYKATPKTALPVKWEPSIHMPKEACRLFLKVKSVRVERLKDISEEDAIAEGIERISSGEFSNVKKWGWRFKDYNGYYQGVFPQYSFQSLWQKINGPASWEANPWVWVVEFERVEKSLIIATPDPELTRETGSQVTIIEKAK